MAREGQAALLSALEHSRWHADARERAPGVRHGARIGSRDGAASAHQHHRRTDGDALAQAASETLVCICDNICLEVTC